MSVLWDLIGTGAIRPDPWGGSAVQSLKVGCGAPVPHDLAPNDIETRYRGTGDRPVGCQPPGPFADQDAPVGQKGHRPGVLHSIGQDNRTKCSLTTGIGCFGTCLVTGGKARQQA